MHAMIDQALKNETETFTLFRTPHSFLIRLTVAAPLVLDFLPVAAFGGCVSLVLIFHVVVSSRIVQG
jgi:hypothetical protein